MDKNKLLAVFALVFIAVCGISYIIPNVLHVPSYENFASFFIFNGYAHGIPGISMDINESVMIPFSSSDFTDTPSSSVILPIGLSHATVLFIGFPFYFIGMSGFGNSIQSIHVYPIPLIIDLIIWFAIVFSVMLVLHNYNLKHALTNKIKTDLNQLHSHNRYAMIGLALIIYAMFLTPAYFEPTDLAISTGWIAFVFSLFPNMLWIIPIWMWTGYVAVMLGAYFVGKRLLFEFGMFGEELYMHPKTAFILVSVLAAVLVAIMHSTILG